MGRTTNPCKHEGARVLLVEGKNDCHVVLALCQAHSVPETFGVYECENSEGILRRLNALVPSPEPPEVIGFLLDADPVFEQRWQSVRTWFQTPRNLHLQGYELPPSPSPGGTVLPEVPGSPRLGFWLMPDNRQSGMLEDFCLDMANPHARSQAEQAVDHAQKSGATTFKDVHRSKAIAHTYLAWQDEPGRPLGQAITAQALDPQTTLAKSFADWLTALFA